MFFLYVLKEERDCPISEVFEKYIKPVKTSRFKSDFGEDYGKLLRKVKRQNRYEKLYDRALKKLKLKNGRREYLSDSCLPSCLPQQGTEHSAYPIKLGANDQSQQRKKNAQLANSDSSSYKAVSTRRRHTSQQPVRA